MGNILAKDPDFWCDGAECPGQEWFNADWMKRVSDSKFLSELSIPGTHNSMSYDVFRPEAGLWVWCQCWNLSNQLNMGVRFLDIRCRSFEGGMPLHHGDYYLNSNLTKALTDIKDFLQTYRSECVIVRVKQEKSKLEGFDFRDALEPYFDEFSSHILKTKSMPTLGEARGKMVILADYDIGVNDDMMKYEHMNIMDNWKPASESEKIDGIKANIEKASSATRDIQEMYITFTSYTWNADSPRELARSANPIAHKIVRDHIGCLGIFVMDFPGYKVPRDIINHN